MFGHPRLGLQGLSFGLLAAEGRERLFIATGGLLVAAGPRRNPPQIAGGEGDAEPEAGCPPHSKHVQEQRLRFLQMPLIRQDLGDVVPPVGRVDFVAGLSSGLRAPLVQVERLGPPALEVRVHSQVVQGIGLAGEVPQLFVDGKGQPSIQRALRSAEAAVEPPQQPIGVGQDLSLTRGLRVVDRPLEPIDALGEAALLLPR